MKLPPASTNASITAWAFVSSAVQPHCIVPRHNSDTRRPVRPRCGYRMRLPYLAWPTSHCLERNRIEPSWADTRPLVRGQVTPAGLAAVQTRTPLERTNKHSPRIQLLADEAHVFFRGG